MLNSLMRGLRRTGLLPRKGPDVLVILNHNPAAPKEPDDVDTYASVDALIRDMRAVDLHEGGYFALDTSGRVIAMKAMGDNPEDLIEATMAPHPTESQLAQRMLKHLLLAEIDDEDEGSDKRRHLIEREYDTKRLLEMLPDRHNFG